MGEPQVATSKFLSFVLRHRPEAVGLQLDRQGWLDVGTLLERINTDGRSITLEELRTVVATNDKQRFEFSPDGLRIRARQGHSLAGVDLELAPREPPDLLYHGTVEKFLASIRKAGLQRGGRNHVHLSPDRATAATVGSRRGRPVVLTIAARQMYLAGFTFYRSANGVWLSAEVPPNFIEFGPPEAGR